MPLPIVPIVAGIAARAVAKKVATKVAGKAGKAAKAARETTKNEARIIAAKRAAATPAAKRTKAEKLAMKRVIPTKSGGLKARPEAKTNIKKLVKESKKSSKPAAGKNLTRKELEYEKIRTTQYNPKTGKKEAIVAGETKASQARMAEFKRQGFGQSGNVVRKFGKK